MNNTKTEVKKMAKDLNRHTEKHDDEILEEKNRIVGDIVKTVTKTKKRKAVKAKKYFEKIYPFKWLHEEGHIKEKQNEEIIKSLKIKIDN